VPAETPARASRVGAAPGIGMSSKKAAARRRRAAEPDVSVAVARAERRLEKFSAARSGSSSRGASLGDAVAYAAIVLGVCLMLSSRRIPVHRPEDFAPMRRAGRLAARALAHVEPHVVPGVDTETLDDVVRAFLSSRGARAATLGYRGYNHSSCISPNEVVCHGVPSKNVVLNAGDIVNVDIAVVTSEGWHADVSKTFFVGGLESADANARRLVDATRDALTAGLDECRPGVKIGDVLEPIKRKLQEEGFGIVDRYAAHGLGKRFHQPPTIRHGRDARRGFGFKLKPGHFFTIEPIATEGGSVATATLRDGWTVVTKDRASRSAQFEHTVGVGERACEIFTRDGDDDDDDDDGR
jgi:methionyl aminopeptidase